jgi:hypothetical protein
LLLVNAVALVAVSLWFRCRSLENIPGINGDEAWYGMQAVETLRGKETSWRTPTGNVLNPLFFGPILLLQYITGSSIAMLRWVAVFGGAAALLVNWLLCHWVFDRRTAAISTVLLAILPINIAYSRFAWDASQSLLATLPVLYLSFAAVRFPQRRGWCLAGAAATCVFAAVVHPTNLLAIAAPIAAAPFCAPWASICRVLRRPAVLAAVVVAGILAAAGALCWFQSSGAAMVSDRLRGSILAQPWTTPYFLVLYPRLFTGATVYQFIAGSDSWLEWPAREGRMACGLDAILFWAVVAAAVCVFWRLQSTGVPPEAGSRDGRAPTRGRIEDRVLLATFGLHLVLFLLLAGPPAIAAGYERYAIVLVAPTVLLIARAAALALEVLPHAGRVALATTALGGWLLLADFQVHYFAFIERTGGQAHQTFRTAAVEPKAAALEVVRQYRRPGRTWVVASEYWIATPLRYLASDDEEVRVVCSTDPADAADVERALAAGDAWFVEFADSEGLEQFRFSPAGRNAAEWQVKDFGGRVVLYVFCPSQPLQPERLDSR